MHDRMILFGGYGGGYRNDVWVLADASGLGGTPTWVNTVQQGAAGSPKGRSWHSAVYDAGTDRMVIFGGDSAGLLNDVWVLANASGLGGPPTWNNTVALGAPGSPSIRIGHSAVYDATTNRMTVFGGFEGAGGGVMNDTWVLTNANGLGGPSTWINTIADGAVGSPPARNGHTAVYAGGSNRMVLFGGAGVSAWNDTWVLTNANGLGGASTWINTIPDGNPGSPPRRDRHSAVYDTTNDLMTVFGGGNWQFNDTWVLANASKSDGSAGWSNIVKQDAPGSPSRRNLHSAIYNQTVNRMIVFGGTNGSAFLNDVWVLSEANGQAVPHTPSIIVAVGMVSVFVAALAWSRGRRTGHTSRLP